MMSHCVTTQIKTDSLSVSTFITAAAAKQLMNDIVMRIHVIKNAYRNGDWVRRRGAGGSGDGERR